MLIVARMIGGPRHGEYRVIPDHWERIVYPEERPKLPTLDEVIHAWQAPAGKWVPPVTKHVYRSTRTEDRNGAVAYVYEEHRGWHVGG